MPLNITAPQMPMFGERVGRLGQQVGKVAGAGLELYIDKKIIDKAMEQLKTQYGVSYEFHPNTPSEKVAEYISDYVTAHKMYEETVLKDPELKKIVPKPVFHATGPEGKDYAASLARIMQQRGRGQFLGEAGAKLEETAKAQGTREHFFASTTQKPYTQSQYAVEPEETMKTITALGASVPTRAAIEKAKEARVVSDNKLALDRAKLALDKRKIELQDQGQNSDKYDKSASNALRKWDIEVRALTIADNELNDLKTKTDSFGNPVYDEGSQEVQDAKKRRDEAGTAAQNAKLEYDNIAEEFEKRQGGGTIRQTKDLLKGELFIKDINAFLSDKGGGLEKTPQEARELIKELKRIGTDSGLKQGPQLDEAIARALKTYDINGEIERLLSGK